MKYREALRMSRNCPECCSQTLERFSKYIRNNEEFYVPCPKYGKLKQKNLTHIKTE